MSSTMRRRLLSTGHVPAQHSRRSYSPMAVCGSRVVQVGGFIHDSRWGRIVLGIYKYRHWALFLGVGRSGLGFALVGLSGGHGSWPPLIIIFSCQWERVTLAGVSVHRFVRNVSSSVRWS